MAIQNRHWFPQIKPWKDHNKPKLFSWSWNILFEACWRRSIRLFFDIVSIGVWSKRFFVHSEHHFWGIRIWWVLDQSSWEIPGCGSKSLGTTSLKYEISIGWGFFLSFLMNSDEISAINYHFIYFIYILSIFFYLFFYYHFIYSVYKYFITISNSTPNSKAVHPTVCPTKSSSFLVQLW